MPGTPSNSPFPPSASPLSVLESTRWQDLPPPAQRQQSSTFCRASACSTETVFAQRVTLPWQMPKALRRFALPWKLLGCVFLADRKRWGSTGTKSLCRRTERSSFQNSPERSRYVSSPLRLFSRLFMPRATTPCIRAPTRAMQPRLQSSCVLVCSVGISVLELPAGPYIYGRRRQWFSGPGAGHPSVAGEQGNA